MKRIFKKEIPGKTKFLSNALKYDSLTENKLR